MSQIGDLTVKIGADTSGLTKGVDDAKKKVDEFDSSTVGASFSLKAFAAAAVAAAAATALVVKRAIDAADAFNDLAERTGISVTVLSRLEYAAKFADVSLGELQSGIVMLTRNMNMASQGTGEAGDALRLLGVRFQNADGSLRASDEVLLDIAEKFSQMRDGANKTALAMDIFGRSGAQIIPLLNQGRDGIQSFGDELQKFGGVITPEAAAQAGIFNDNLDRLKAAAAGAANQMAQSLLPGLNKVLSYLIALNEVRMEKGFWTTLFGGFAEEGSVIERLFDGETVKKRIKEVFDGIREEQQKQLEDLNKPDTRPDAPSIAGGLSDADRKALEDKVRAIQDSYKTEQELLVQKLAEDQRILNEARAKGLISQEEYNLTLQELQANHFAKLAELEENSPEAKRLEALQQNLLALQEYFLSEEEAYMVKYERQLELLRESMLNELLTIEEYNALKAEAEQRYSDEITKIREKAMTDMEKFTAMSYKKQAQTIFAELSNITAGVSSNNKTMFEMNKAAGIANAIVSAYEGISRTMAKYPYPISIGMAAAQAAAAFAQVRAISSQSFNGGGGAAPSLAGGTAATPVSPVSGGVPGAADAFGGGQVVSINLQGEVFGREQVRGLIGQINEAISDGAVLRVQ
jgi:hypothetical protein